MSTVLNVFLYDRLIGTLTSFPGDQNLFAFTEEYIADSERPTLSLSFKDQLGGLITDIRPTQTRVPQFFANLLPEGPLRDYLANRAGVHSSREFHLLAILGRDLPGAVTLLPADGQVPADDDHHDDDRGDDHRDHALRFSLAGVQLKFSAIMHSTGGLTIPANGAGGSWIVKLPSGKFEGVPENEYSMMTLASRIGIDVPEMKLVDLDDIEGLPGDMGQIRGQAFAVKRFDRVHDGGRIHIEDFAQVFRVYPERKYERASYKNIAEVIWAETGEQGIAEFVRRLIFNMLIGNADMHLKNWSLAYPDRQHPVLTPAYDFVATIAYLTDGNMALNLAGPGSKNMAGYSTEALIRFAAKARLPERLILETATETVGRFLDVWNDSRRELPIPSETIEVLEKHLNGIELVKEVREPAVAHA